MSPGLSLEVKNAASGFTFVFEGWWLSFGVLPLFFTLCELYKGKKAVFWSFSSAVLRRGGETGMKKILSVYFWELSISMYLIYLGVGLGGAVGGMQELMLHPL